METTLYRPARVGVDNWASSLNELRKLTLAVHDYYLFVRFFGSEECNTWHVSIIRKRHWPKANVNCSSKSRFSQCTVTFWLLVSMRQRPYSYVFWHLFQNENDLRPHKHISTVSILIPTHTDTPEKAYHVAIHAHWARVCWCKQKTDYLLRSFSNLQKILETLFFLKHSSVDVAWVTLYTVHSLTLCSLLSLRCVSHIHKQNRFLCGEAFSPCSRANPATLCQQSAYVQAHLA